MGVRHPHPRSPAGWAPPSPAMRERGSRPIDPPHNSPSPAVRERVPRAARRVRVGSRNFIYREPLSSRNAQQERSPAPPIIDRCRAADVVGATRSPAVPIQVPSAAPDRRLHHRLRMHPACIGNRARRRPTRGQCGGCAPNRMARKSRLARNPLLEQRCFNQYRGCGRSYPARASRAINPHPLGASRRAPPSPAVRQRVPRAARRVRVSAPRPR
jgi:hypothetical protein